MDEYIPQLTLTPDLSAQAQPEVKKEEDLITKAQAAPEAGPDLPALSPLRAILHNPASLPTLFPPSFPPPPLAAGNLPVLLLLRFLLEFDPNSVISLQPLLPALPANSDTLPDFARNRPFFRLCREYPLLPLFLHQYLPAGVSL